MRQVERGEIRRRRSLSERGKVLRERTRRHKKQGHSEERGGRERDGRGSDGEREGRNFAACVVTQWIFQSITIN